jgi:anti-anti-sigma factor
MPFDVARLISGGGRMFGIAMIVGTDDVVVTMRGELEYAVISDAHGKLTELKLLKKPTYVVDLTQLTAIDSSGLGVLFSISNVAAKNGSQLSIRGATGAVLEILKMTRFDTLASID